MPLAKIYYRVHPDFGKEVAILRRFHIMAGNHVQIRLRTVHNSQYWIGCWTNKPAKLMRHKQCGDDDERVWQFYVAREAGRERQGRSKAYRPEATGTFG